MGKASANVSTMVTPDLQFSHDTGRPIWWDAEPRDGAIVR
jgi:hypothetical protein